MRIYHSQLGKQLSKPLLPVWLIFGDEPWQKNDSLDTLKQHALKQGYDELIRFTCDDKFDWNQVYQEYQSLSLFSALRIIEIDMLSSKIDDKAVKILIEISQLIEQQGQSDVLLILHGAKLDGNTPRKKWFKALDKIGCYIPLYDLEGKSLSIWLSKQCQKLSLKLDHQAQSLLIDFFAGNIPALQQELEKLAILFNHQFINVQDLEKLLIKQAKFTPFQLVDALLSGDLSQCMNMLTQLKHEGTASTQLIWILHKEINQLEKMKKMLLKQSRFPDIFNEFKVWDKKKPLYQHALNNMSLENIKLSKQRLAKTDLISKTSSDFDEYILLSDVCLTLYHGNVTRALALDYEFYA